MERRFGEAVPIQPTAEKDVPPKSGTSTKDGLLSWIRHNEIGYNEVIETPFGRREMVYCDYAASARAIAPIEQYITEEVLPLYGNTHSSVTVSSEQTTLFVHEARQEIRAMTGAGDNDSVILTGSGATAAVDLLIHLIGEGEIVVVHSDREHHSNLLPWRHRAKQCYEVEESPAGLVCLVSLRSVLEKVKEVHPSTLIIGTFTAASNVTGLITNVTEVAKTLRSFGALSFWDYATAAPYVDINVNGTAPLDAIFFSGHKFIGATSTPGVLVVKKKVIKATSPKRIGGGTVFFVSPGGEWYLKDAEYREEGGTPDAVGAVRLALAIKLKRAVGEERIKEQEHTIVSRLISGLSSIPNLHLLGPSTSENRLPVISILLEDKESGLFLHHNYVSALLNDLFGIQSRPGCVCAGPYAQKLLGIDNQLADRFVSVLREKDGLDRTHLRRVGEYSHNEMLRPGFTRLSLPYFFTNEQVDFVVDAVRFVAEHATQFMHLYHLNGESAEWHHHKQRTFHSRKWLGHVEFGESGMRVHRRKGDTSTIYGYKTSIERAFVLLEEAKEVKEKSHVPDGRDAVDASATALRWFLLPIEVREREKGAGVQYPTRPFHLKEYVQNEKTIDSILENGVSTIQLDASEDVAYDEFEELEDKEEAAEASTPSENIVCDVITDGATFCEIAASQQDCPLDPADQGKGRMGDLGTDENEEDVKNSEDWNRRVIVRPIEMTKAEKSQLAWVKPPLPMYKTVTEAIHGLDMIKDGDRILVCLSGGKDSLAMLHILHFYRERCIKNRSTKFDLGAITVDPGSTAYNPRPLIDYCRQLNIEYFYEEQDIIGMARKLGNVRSICAFCSRLKRGRLAAAAQLHGYNVLAMGQHLDDLAESFFIAAFQNGNLSTMKAQYTTRDGALRVIRPMVFVREKALREFAEKNELPVIAENCPACFSSATERHRIKQMLASQELVFPELFHSLRSALKPLLLVDSACTDEMRAKAIENIVQNNKGKIKMDKE